MESRREPYSLNQATTKYWPLEDVIAASAKADLEWIGLWREPIQEYGVDKAARLVADAGLKVSTLCRSGFFTSTDPAERASKIEDNRRAIDEAATVGTSVLVLVSGGLPPGSRDLDGPRSMVRDGLAELAPYAAERGVRLAVEALHPMFCSDRCVVSSLGGALDLAEQFPASQVGDRRCLPPVVGRGRLPADRAGRRADPVLPGERLGGSAAGGHAARARDDGRRFDRAAPAARGLATRPATTGRSRSRSSTRSCGTRRGRRSDLALARYQEHVV